jgi:REP element-mobilizing transposase RayT
MPNHVHVLVETIAGHTLSGRKGAFWQSEYFDRYMRNESHVAQTVEYIEQNPVKAGLVAEASDWRWSSARHRRSFDIVPVLDSAKARDA